MTPSDARNSLTHFAALIHILVYIYVTDQKDLEGDTAKYVSPEFKIVFKVFVLYVGMAYALVFVLDERAFDLLEDESVSVKWLPDCAQFE